MSKKRIVVAIGRIGFGDSFPEQKINIKKAAKAIADLVEEDYQVLITHSNGPQIGMLHSSLTEYSKAHKEHTVAPLSVCSALSQGYMGYDLQNMIRTELLNRGIFRTVVTLITQVKVDPFDKAFRSPTKTIGRYMTEEEALLEKEKGNHVIFKEGKGYRRVIASPKPLEVYEIDAIKTLLDGNQVVIAGGGGGIPVLEQGSVLKGASAVIEKDYTSELLAHNVGADTLLFLTDTKKVLLQYGTDNEEAINNINLSLAKQYVSEGQFEEGSMLPKINASIDFLSKNPNGHAIISHIEDALSAVNGKTGSHITIE